MIGIKVPGQFVPGTVNGFVTEARWVRGTYVVVNTVDEANLIPLGSRVDGTLVYVLDTDTEYRWKDGDWEVIPKAFSDAPVDGKIYARQNGLWTVIEVDSIENDLESVKEELSQKANTSDLTNLQTQIDKVEADLLNYVPKSELENYTEMELFEYPDIPQEPGESNKLYFVKTENGGYQLQIWWPSANQFIIVSSTEVDFSDYYTKEEIDSKLSTLEGMIPDVSNLATKEELNQKADINSVPTSTSQLTNDSGFIINSVDDLVNYDTTSVIDNKLSQKADKSEIPDVSGLVTDTELASGLDSKQDTLISAENIKTINGQDILGAGDLTVEATEVTAEAVSGALDELYGGEPGSTDNELVLNGNG